MEIREFAVINETSAKVKVNFKKGGALAVGSKGYWEFVNSITQGIQWKNKGETVKIIEEGMTIRGLPDFSFRKVIAVKLNPKDTEKNQLWVYHSDGQLIKTIPLPMLISSLALENKIGNEASKYFDHVRWLTNNRGEQVFGIKISFGWYLFEMRTLNTETFEFGACLYTGRD